ncbi:TPA: hypothetical protein ACINQE_000155 [Streptococcus agalactiae]|uniref:hypothetical protein n=1 Tax=Streptococcus agalactiae TaxID=1311 RepID=UPI0005DD1CF5|nr:hypothetical protein [Streptococcus agalactiae]HEP3841734.1 hypothetical protein [Streptococcus pyogenes]CFQ77923.1 phage protein [Streptococcus agalactiae]CNK15446.1 phage protein [Streptococcus agalactiae]CQJ46246.1 phage protein [Streptococcus agalactiae]HEN0882684.1 hypothetical protein [Streptococcus agalactiae]
MNNLQIIAVGTIISVTLIESLISNIKLRKALKTKDTAGTITTQHIPQRGFIDYKTGRRVDIDPETKKEVFVD